MTTGLRRPTTEAVNSRLLILPFCMDAIVHKHAATLRQLPGNIFDVAQSRSLEHHRSPTRILRKTHYFFGRRFRHTQLTSGTSQRMRSTKHISMIPFDRTAHGWKLLFRPIPRVGDLLHRFKQVAASVRDGRHSRRIEATSVLQLILCIDAKEIGRALRAIGARPLPGSYRSRRER